MRERHTDEAGDGPHCTLRKETVREFYIVPFDQRIRPLLATTDLLSSSVATSLTEIGTQTFLSSRKHSYRNAKLPSRGVFRKGYHSQKGIGVSKSPLSGPFKVLAREAAHSTAFTRPAAQRPTVIYVACRDSMFVSEIKAPS